MSKQILVLKNIFALLLISMVTTWTQAVEIVLTEDGISGLNIGDDGLVSVKEVSDSFPEFSVLLSDGYWEGPGFDLLTVVDSNGTFVFSIISYRDVDESVQREKFPIHKIYLGNGILDEYGIKVGDEISKAFSVRGNDLVLVDNHHDNSLGKGRIYYMFDFPLTKEEIEMQNGVNWGFAKSIQDVKDRNPPITNVVWINWP
jgi:hypothetical protein